MRKLPVRCEGTPARAGAAQLSAPSIQSLSTTSAHSAPALFVSLSRIGCLAPRLAALLLLTALHAPTPARAASSQAPYLSAPLPAAQPIVSTAATARAYRNDAARHIYQAYAPRVYKGRLPPMLYGVVVVELSVDAAGIPRRTQLIRGPKHAPHVSAAVIELIRRAGPLPKPSRALGAVKFIEIWLVREDGSFQLDALTEGQD